MDYASLIKLPSGSFGRKDIEIAASSLEGFAPTLLNNLIADLLNRGIIERVGHGIYVRTDNHGRSLYRPQPSVEATIVADILCKNLSHIEYRVWSLSYLNEFLNHQLTSSVIIAQVEQEGMSLAFKVLQDSLDSKTLVFLRPNADAIACSNSNTRIAVTRLVSEAPSAIDDNQSAALEQMMVEMFADKLVSSMLSNTDYPSTFEKMFEKYVINESTLFRYARRRGKKEKMLEFLQDKTSVELHKKTRNGYS